MKFFVLLFHTNALFGAVEKGNIDILKLLLQVPGTDINTKCI